MRRAASVDRVSWAYAECPGHVLSLGSSDGKKMKQG